MRKGGRRSSAFVSSSSGEQGFWPSYADMMSAVALILFFLMLLSYIQNMITGNNLRGAEEELAQARADLAVTAQQVQDAQKELEVIFDELEIARQDLDNQQIHIDEQADEIAKQQAHIQEQADEITSQQASINEQRETIARQQAQADRQQAYLDATQAELSTLRNQMREAATIRFSVVDQIRRNIESVMGSSNTVTVNENGNLVLSESVLFDRGSAELKAASKQVLDQLSEGFASFLANPENTRYVDTIVIAGHADSTGSAELNRELSSKRANSVLSYLLQTRGNALDRYSQYFCASGYGATRPIADNSTPEGQAKNRRIEISIVLKDESVLDLLDQYLAIEVPKG